MCSCQCTQTHMQTCTDLHSMVQCGTVGAPAKHMHAHTHVHSLFLLWSQREHTDLISPSQLASLGTNNPLRPFPPTEPIRAVTHCVSLSLCLSVPSICLSVYACWSVRSTAKCTVILFKATHPHWNMGLITQDHVHKTFITCTLQCHSFAKDEPSWRERETGLQ